MPDLKPCQSEWKPIEGWPYSVSDDGHVRNDRTGHILKMHEMNRGYLDVLLCNNGISQNKTVHRLVAEAFIPNPECKPQVNHKDGNRLNNNVDNLEWLSLADNIRHGFENNLYKQNKTTLESEDTGEIYTFRSQTEAGAFLGRNRGYITGLVKNKRNFATTADGKRFFYKVNGDEH